MKTLKNLFVYVLGMGAAIMVVTSCGESSPSTPKMTIHEAAFMGDANSIEKHIKAGTDLNQKDEYGSTPLNITAVFGRTEAAIKLIEGGADINFKSGDGSTPLHTAAFFCRTEIVNALLAKGVDQSIKDAYGSTAREAVSAPFEAVKPIYEQMGKDLGPFGLRLDYEKLEATRPKIAEMLKG